MSFVVLLALSFFASPKLAPPDEQALKNLQSYAAAHFDAQTGLVCTAAASTGSAKTITIDFADNAAAHRGTPASVDSSMIPEIFAVSSSTEFRFSHWGNLNGKTAAVYTYSYQVNGKTRAGLIFADEATGAISRITFRGADSASHLFCSR